MLIFIIHFFNFFDVHQSQFSLDPLQTYSNSQQFNSSVFNFYNWFIGDRELAAVEVCLSYQ